MRRKRFSAIILCIVMTLSLTACGNDGQNVEKVENATEVSGESRGGGDGNKYVAEDVSFEGMSDGIDFSVRGNELYYLDFEYDESTKSNYSMLKTFSMEDGSIHEISLAKEGRQYVGKYTVDEENNIAALLYEHEQPDETGYVKSTAWLTRYDLEGEISSSADITELLAENENGLAWVKGMEIDREGTAYLCLEKKIILFDAKGEELGQIDVDGWFGSLCRGTDGKVYTLYYSNHEKKFAFAQVEADKKALSPFFRNFPGSVSGTVAPVSENTFLVTDGTNLKEYNTENQTCTDMLSWVDCDVIGANIEYLGMAQNGKILAIIRSNEEGSSPEMVQLTKAEKGAESEKKQIVVGILYENSQLQDAAVSFNKSSDEYRVELRTYINDSGNQSDNSYEDALMAVNNDIVSKDNCPDIIDLSMVNEKAFYAKGVFEDLRPYLEKSEKLKPEDFLDGILEHFTYDGKLYSIPATFSLLTVAGKKSVLGDRMGWTQQDMVNLAEAQHGGSLFGDATKRDVLYYCLKYGMDGFINWEKAECNFDSDEFKQILKFVDGFPDKIDLDSYTESDLVEDMQSGQVVLDVVSVDNFQSVQMCQARFGEEVNFIGFPTIDGSAGCDLSTGNRYGISTKSAHKEGAWAFLEYYLLNYEQQQTISWGFPTKKDAFQKKLAEETADDQEEYSIYLNDWKYTYQQPTAEEIEKVEELIKTAVPAYNRNDFTMDIIMQEAESYFTGQKSVEDVVKIIQSRMQMYVSENS